MLYWVFRKDHDLGTLRAAGEGPFTTAEQASFVARELERKDDIPRYILGAQVFYYAEP